MAPKRCLSVMSVVGTRPEAIKLAPVLKSLKEQPDKFKSILCSTGQHREMLDQTLEAFDLVTDRDLKVMVAGQTLTGLTASVVTAFDAAISDFTPDVVLVQGDTTSAMVCALAAFYARVPVGHVEAGLRTGDRYNPFPEEINRRLISSLASWHYAPTEGAVQALLREGIDPRSVLLTGNTVVDALLDVAARVDESEPTPGERMILVTAHRRESFGKPFEDLCLALREIVERNPDVRIIYPVHLNPNVREPVHRILGDLDRLELREPVSYAEMVRLMKSCYLVLTDSGGVQEEAPVFGKPVLVLRETSERPEAVAAGVAKIVGTDRGRIREETETLLKDPEAYLRMSRAISPYGDGQAAGRITRHLASLIPGSGPPSTPQL
jgi:UDP-N-acetylglucosamine 2-epimerase (non-hydrolysing)